MVQLVKKKLREQGSKFTYASAVKAALSSQVQDEIKENLQEELKQKTNGKSRTKTNNTPGIEVMVNELTKGSIFSYIPGREFNRLKITRMLEKGGICLNYTLGLPSQRNIHHLN